MNKIILIVLIILGVIVLLAAAFFFLGSGPVYTPGKMKSRKGLESFLTPPPQTGTPEGYWKVTDKMSLYYFTDGMTNRTPVLIVHGGPGFPPDSPWQGLRPLTDRYTFYYYHQRGCGKSTRPFDRFESKNYYQNMLSLIGELGMEQQIADIERIRRILHQDKLIVIGHSFGGFLAALYALEFPERVEKLVLVSPADMLVMPQKNGGLFETVKKELKDEKLSEYNRFMKEYFNYGSIFQKSEKELAQMNLDFAQYYTLALQNKGLKIKEAEDIKLEEAGGWMPQGMYMNMALHHDYRSALAKIDCPVLIIHAEKDMVMTMDAIDTYKNSISNAKLTVIPDAAHHSFDDQPKLFAEAVDNFLKGE